MAKLRWTAEAEKWLRDIYRYIAADNPRAAERVVEGIYCLVEQVVSAALDQAFQSRNSAATRFLSGASSLSL